MYDYFQELFRLNNINKTLATTFFKVKELKTQIDANVFSITYAKGQIGIKTDLLLKKQEEFDEMQTFGNKLSRDIEEAEISHMRTEQIFDKIKTYTEYL